MLYSLISSFLFLLDPEKAHEKSLFLLERAYQTGLIRKNIPTLPCKWMGLPLENPVGLAAGLDKNGAFIDALATFGFGFIEVGTVTPRPQPGNPKPRLFRLTREKAIINRMGFNNLGVDHLVQNLKKTRYRGILGINIGKNSTTPLEEAIQDYLTGLKKTYPYASYITINISSPNTQRLRELQAKENLSDLLYQLKEAQAHLAQQYGKYVPLALKIAPDLSEENIKDIATLARTLQLDGLIATNTSIDKSLLSLDKPEFIQEGGISGAPLKEKADHVLTQLVQELDNSIPVVGVGGIIKGCDASRKLQLGAKAVQLYSGLVYRGPELVAECVENCASLQKSRLNER